MSRPAKLLIVRLTRFDKTAAKPKWEATILAVPIEGDRLSLEMDLEDKAHRKQHRIEFLGEAQEVTTASSLTKALALI